MNTVRRLCPLPIIGSLCIWASASIAVENTLEVDLRNGEGGVVALPSPEAGTHTTRNVLLPEFEKFCHVAADSDFVRWIGASNRMFPWVGKDNLTDIFRKRSPKPPVISAPNRRAFQMLFELTDGRFMVLMPLSGDDSISWLQTSKDGQLTLDYGSLGTEPVPADSKVPLLSWCVRDNLYEALAHWGAPVSTT